MSSSSNVLVIGSDLTSNGGIASVVKAFYSAHKSGNYPYRMYLLKTNFYKDRGLLGEVLIFFLSLFRAVYYSIFCGVGVFHVHSSARRSFYRKACFVILAKLLGKRIVFHIHSSEFYSFFLKESRFISFILGLSDRVVVLCEDWRIKLRARYPDLNIVKIENPYDVHVSNRSSCSYNDGRFNVIFVGFFIESKGVRDLIDLAKMVKINDVGNIVIQIAGKGELEGFIKDSIEKYSLHDCVELIGWVSGGQKDQLFRSASAFILPSYKEGMPISILEAMAWGLPIISTRIAGTPDIVEDGVNGYLFRPGDVKGYFDAILKLYGDSSLGLSIANNNEARVSLNTKHYIFKQVNAVYAELRSA